MNRTTSLLLTVVLFVACSAVADESTVDYNRDVRPIFSDKCYQCHGPDAAQRPTDLRLDDQSVLRAELESGARAVVVGDADRSEVYARITHSDAELAMPPSDSGKQLTKQEIQTIKRWIEEGAEWGVHWSFAAPELPQLPSVNLHQWPRAAIDYFVLARLEQEGWHPSDVADKRTLIRRATLALTGLPPTIDEVEDFLADESPDAYEQLVDRLLQSPRCGEHLARYWLDVARYGDTHGLHLDNERSIWRYRDWVINAICQGMPFDQFTIEQLAGDLLPDATLQQRIATGFHRCNVTTSEGGAIAEEFLARYAVERVETTSTAWLGMTMGCAACHDHKFDPVTQEEFYQLYAYFYNLTEKAMDGNALAPAPSLKAPTHVQQIRYQQLQNELVELENKLEQRRQRARQEQENWEPKLAASFRNPMPTEDTSVHCRLDRVDGDRFPVQGSAAATGKVHGKVDWAIGKIGDALALQGKGYLTLGNVADFDHVDHFSFGGWINIASKEEMAILSKTQGAPSHRGYELCLAEGKVAVRLVNQWEDKAIEVRTRLPLSKEKWHHVFATYDGSGKAAGLQVFVDGKQQELDTTSDSLKASIRSDAPLRIGRRHADAPFFGLIDDVRVYPRALGADEIGNLATHHPLADILATAASKRSDLQQAQLMEAYFQRYDRRAIRLLQRRRELRRRIAGLENEFPRTLVMQDRDQWRDAYVLVRGQYDKKGKPVLPDVPAVLPPIADKSDRTRLALARWLVDARHPLTARVTVNRIWQQHFGVGLVRSAEDFGSQGEWPSHPDLLDYLAIRLIETEWDIKALHRLIVTSATFRQSSWMSKTTFARDPENRLLSRGPRFRLDAEVIRDVALSVSGLMAGQIGGPSVKPYQPSGLWEAVAYPSSTTANFKQDEGSKLYRRSMYTFWKRTSPPPSMQILDAPSREVCKVRRPRTNTPATALLMMNDVQFVEAARKFAERILTEGGDSTPGRIEFAYQVALARLPNRSESVVVEKMVRDCQAVYESDEGLAPQLLSHGDSSVSAQFKPSELATWTMVASTLLNLDETISQH